MGWEALPLDLVGYRKRDSAQFCFTSLLSIFINLAITVHTDIRIVYDLHGQASQYLTDHIAF